MTKSGAGIMVAMTTKVVDCDGQIHFGAFLHDVSAGLSVLPASITCAIIAMTKAVGLKTIAEGGETMAQPDFWPNVVSSGSC